MIRAQVSTSVAPDWRPTASLGAIRARARALHQVRQFFAARDVLEVQTPLLGSHGVTDPELAAFRALAGVDQAPVGVLQTSTEYHQKRLLAAGLGDNYTLGPVFRADEQGQLHSPEFTMLEWYRVGFDDVQLMQELSALVDLLLGPADYSTHTYADLVGQVSLTAAESRDVPVAAHADLLLAKALAALGPGRQFVTGYPAAEAVLARLDPDDPTIARRFELVINGVEIANGYFELTDPALHRDRFERDRALRVERQLTAVEPDAALLAAIDHGLPDCAGVAVGFDRLLMLMLAADAIDEVQAFGWRRR